MGASSDPVKVAKFRSAQAAYSRCVKQNNCVDVQYLRKFVRLSTNAGEHTWYLSLTYSLYPIYKQTHLHTRTHKGDGTAVTYEDVLGQTQNLRTHVTQTNNSRQQN